MIDLHIARNEDGSYRTELKLDPGQDAPDTLMCEAAMALTFLCADLLPPEERTPQDVADTMQAMVSNALEWMSGLIKTEQFDAVIREGENNE